MREIERQITLLKAENAQLRLLEAQVATLQATLVAKESQIATFK